jgi:hypothetical protein
VVSVVRLVVVVVVDAVVESVVVVGAVEVIKDVNKLAPSTVSSASFR